MSINYEFMFCAMLCYVSHIDAIRWSVLDDDLLDWILSPLFADSEGDGDTSMDASRSY